MLAGTASIKAQQTRMNVIGDNLANINTTGFKGSRVSFQDLMSQTTRGAQAPNGKLGGLNPIQTGLGVQIGSTDINGTQGSLSATNRPTDLAIQGNGFFQVTDGTNTYYTRDGAFSRDSAGNLVQSATGMKLVGWNANALGQIDTSAAPTDTLNIPLGSLSAMQATTSVSMTGNLNADAAATDSISSKVRVYDAQGGAHDLTVKFTNKSAAGTGAPAGAATGWDWEVFDGATSLGSSAGTGNTPLYFDASGKAVSASTNGITLNGSSVNLDFGSISQLKSESQVALKSQNGYAPGSLQGFSIGTDGVISGIFSNGLTRNLGQIATAQFTNPEGLDRVGSNLLRATNNSGIANVGAPTTGGRGSLSSGYLEQSNVDISQEFTDLIITQRGFQANTKIVTTVDQMLEELMNLKR